MIITNRWHEIYACINYKRQQQFMITMNHWVQSIGIMLWFHWSNEHLSKARGASDRPTWSTHNKTSNRIQFLYCSDYNWNWFWQSHQTRRRICQEWLSSWHSNIIWRICSHASTVPIDSRNLRMADSSDVLIDDSFMCREFVSWWWWRQFPCRPAKYNSIDLCLRFRLYLQL